MATDGLLPNWFSPRNESTTAFFNVSDEKCEWASAGATPPVSVASTRSVPARASSVAPPASVTRRRV